MNYYLNDEELELLKEKDPEFYDEILQMHEGGSLYVVTGWRDQSRLHWLLEG